MLKVKWIISDPYLVMQYANTLVTQHKGLKKKEEEESEDIEIQIL